MAGRTSRNTAAKNRAARNAPARSRKAAAGSPEANSATARIDEMIAGFGDWRGARLAELRALIHEVDPEVVEEWKWRGAPVWSHQGMYAVANAFKDKVKITFHHGAQLKDPKQLFNAGLNGNKWRAIDLFEGDKLNRTAFKALVREAVAYNSSHEVPKSKGSTALTRGEAKAKAKPVLLAGGNPRIAKGDGDAPVQAFIAAMPGWKRDLGRRLDALIVRAVPDVHKAVRWNSPFFGVEDQGWFLNFHCFTKYIKVAFFRGSSLRPLPPGESKQEEVRYLDIHERDALDEALLASWVKQAAALPGWAP